MPPQEGETTSGLPHVPVNEGISAGTVNSISLTSGEGTLVAAGEVGPGAALHHFEENWQNINTAIAATVGFLSAASATAASTLATGHLAGIALAADWGGWVGGLTLPHLLMMAKGKVGCVSATETLIAAGATLCCTAVGPVSIISPVESLVAGGLGVCVVGGGNVEVVSITRNVILHARAQNVQIEAERNVDVEALIHVNVTAETGNLVAQAERNVTLQAREENLQILAKGWSHYYVDKDIHIRSAVDQRIVLEAGCSTITLTKDEITLQGKRILLVSADNNNTVTLNNEGNGNYAFSTETSGRQKLEAEGDVDLNTQGNFNVRAHGTTGIEMRQININYTEVNYNHGVFVIG